jgi:hypothetical protein
LDWAVAGADGNLLSKFGFRLCWSLLKKETPGHNPPGV